MFVHLLRDLGHLLSIRTYQGPGCLSLHLVQVSLWCPLSLTWNIQIQVVPCLQGRTTENVQKLLERSQAESLPADSKLHRNQGRFS